MNRVAQRIVDRGDLLGNLGIELPDVLLRNHDEIREGALPVDAQDLDVLAEMEEPAAAGVAESAVDVRFTGDPIAGPHERDLGADRFDDPREFMARDERGPDP